MLLLSKRENEKMLIELDNQGKTTRDIAKEVHISLKDIGKIIHKATGDYIGSSQKFLLPMEKQKQKSIHRLSRYKSMMQIYPYNQSIFRNIHNRHQFLMNCP